jgi:hypothetical protein
MHVSHMCMGENEWKRRERSNISSVKVYVHVDVVSVDDVCMFTYDMYNMRYVLCYVYIVTS